MIFFNLMVHVGTLVSIVVIFRRPLWHWWHGPRADVSRLPAGSAPWLTGWWRHLHLRLTLLCMVSVGVTGVPGLSLND